MFYTEDCICDNSKEDICKPKTKFIKAQNLMSKLPIIALPTKVDDRLKHIKDPESIRLKQIMWYNLLKGSCCPF